MVQFQVCGPVASVSNATLGQTGADVILKTAAARGEMNCMRTFRLGGIGKSIVTLRVLRGASCRAMGACAIAVREIACQSDVRFVWLTTDRES
jgi:hypothetical protein